MATKSFSGQLDRPLNTDPAGGDKIFFYPLNTVGEIIESAASIMEIDSSGNYSITLGYNNYSLYYYSDVSKKKTFITTVTVSADTAVSTLPDLIGSTVPITSEVELAVQGYLADAEQARDDAQTAATEAEAAQAATEALFDTGFDSNVATSVGLAATPYPDLHIPFNDGLRIESGYGTNDQIDVSAAQDGSVMVDLPSMSVDFTRSSTSTVINKSGALTDLVADEAGIGSDGVWLHGSYTNLMTYSEFDGGYPIASATQFTSTLVKNGFTLGYFESNSVSFIDKAITSGSDASFSCVMYTGDLADGDFLRVRVEASGSSTEAINIDVYKDVDGTDTFGDNWSLQYEKLGGNLCRVHALFDASINSNGNDNIRIAIYPVNVDTTGDSGYGYYGAFQLCSGIKAVLPYIKTYSTSQTATATYCTADFTGNVNPTKGFSIVFDFLTRTEQTTTNTLFWLAQSGVGALYMDLNGNVYRVVSSGSTISSPILEGEIRSVITVDEDYNVNLYLDGESKGSITIGDPSFLESGDLVLQLGTRNNGNHLNGQIKNFKIYHSTLTADQVKALGAAE